MANPAAEVDIDVKLVKELLAEQFPDLADLAIERAAEGWDNVVFRLGAELSVRMPRREFAAYLVANEHRWGGELVEGLDLPLGVAVPTGLGRPGCGYRWPWTIGPWFQGQNAEVAPPTDPPMAAEVLGAFLALIHRPSPPDGPRSLWRGVPLADRGEGFRNGLALLAATDSVGDELAGIDVEALEAMWEQALHMPGLESDPMWLHGDVHPLNLIVDGGGLVAVIDLGDLCVGDPASDLAVGWMLFDAEAREVFRRAVCQGAGVGPDPTPDRWDALWCRGWGWALALGVAFANGDDRVRDIGIRTLHRAIAQPPMSVGGS